MCAQGILGSALRIRAVNAQPYQNPHGCHIGCESVICAICIIAIFVICAHELSDRHGETILDEKRYTLCPCCELSNGKERGAGKVSLRPFFCPVTKVFMFC